YSVAEGCRVVHDHICEMLFLKPATHQSVPTQKDDEGMHPRLFKGCCEEESEVKTRSKPRLGNVRRRPDLLSLTLKAGWRHRVVDSHRADRGPNRGRDLRCAARASGLVTIQRRR